MKMEAKWWVSQNFGREPSSERCRTISNLMPIICSVAVVSVSVVLYGGKGVNGIIFKYDIATPSYWGVQIVVDR